jgi:hypothetical protein
VASGDGSAYDSLPEIESDSPPADIDDGAVVARWRRKELPMMRSIEEPSCTKAKR